MNKGQYYAQLDACKLALNSTNEILAVHHGDSNYNGDIIIAANRLTDKALNQISRVLSETNFEELESDEED
jgi:hypothetical protein